MISPTSATTPAEPVSRPTAAGQQPSQSKSKSPGADAVQLSSAALAALQETRETPAQTAKEAASGDIQAQRLLAREAAEK